MSSAYSNPKNHKLSRSFRPSYPIDPNSEYSYDQDDCQITSEALYRQSTVGKIAIDSLCRLVIGKGLTPMSAPETAFLGWTDEEAQTFQRQAESYWRLVTGSPSFDFYGKDNFKQLQAIAFKNILVAGDTLLHLGYRKDSSPYIQLISGRMVTQNEPDSLQSTGGVLIQGGKEVGYKIRKIGENREDTFETYTVNRYNKLGRLEFDLISLCKSDPSLVRGIPILTALRDDILNYNKYKDNHLLQSAVQSLFTAFIEKESAKPEQPTVYEKLVAANEEPSVETDQRIELASGNMVDLEPGEHVNVVQRQVQGEDFDAYTKSVAGMIFSASGTSFETAMNTYNSSFSASRAGISGTEKNVAIVREEFCSKFCNPVWAQVIEHGILTGAIKAPRFFESKLTQRAILACTWVGVTPPQVDPTKEVKAYVEAVKAGLCTKEYAVRMLYGLDYDEVSERIRKEKKYE